jgi:hypothetical protein
MSQHDQEGEMPDEKDEAATHPAAPAGGKTITGTATNTKGQVAIGENIRQTQTYFEIGAKPTAEELKQLTDKFAELKAQVAKEAPPDVRDEAVRQTEVLEQATNVDKPDVSAMAAAKSWFLRHAPGLLGAVTSVVINPIVGKIVHAAGEAVANEYEKWFPEAKST